METKNKRVGILCAGGPAPGINSVVGAATIRSILAGRDVVGIEDGFKWLMQGDYSHIRELTITDVSRIHFQGGSALGISRENPTKNPADMQTTINSLLHLNIDKLITIGGDDTAFSAMNVEKEAGGRISVVHVPKTIDNDLDLPHGLSTFGYQTARHVGVNLVKNLMVDAQTTKRWYLAVTMGRKAGHLALGIGKAAGATLSIIPEEFGPDNPISMRKIVDMLVGAIIKRMSYEREDGVAVIAEGLVELLSPEELHDLENVEKDAHGHIRIAEINFGEILKREVQKRLAQLGLKSTLVAKDIGYELRCADPIPFDMEYTRDLGHSAAEFILNGGTGAMVSMQSGRLVPMYFKDIIDKKTGRTRVRMVNTQSERYKIAQRYMIKLTEQDFEDDYLLSKCAATAHMPLEKFRETFSYVIPKNGNSD